MIEPVKLSPFKRFCVTIGNLPTTYMESLSYYEMLEWLCNYIEKTVIPAINNNSEALEEVQQAFVELKNYIDTYFDNLDIQTEINNKLDDMAESGQLTEIIAQYLNLAGVLAYNTLNDLKAAENITEGSITRILGRNTYNDGYGSYYKIRKIVNTDVIDNDNIISITNDNTLVGEKIKNPTIKCYIVKNSDSFDTIQEYFNQDTPKEIIFEKGTYTFNNTFRVNKNTKINLNNSNLIFNVPKWSVDWENSHGFFNFKSDDVLLGYNGNSNIKIYNGTITHGNISFCHAYNIEIENIHFVDCNNNHAIEICAINNIIINNCIFEGCWTDGTHNENECIQFDEATYSNFPFFNDEDNESYDNTYPKNITIKNCEFKNSTTENYVMCNCIGNDSYIEDSYIENILIENNYFNDSINLSIQLYNVKDVMIKNNKFYCSNATAITNEGSHIRFRNQFNNIKIEDNIFESNYRAIQTANPDGTKDNLNIINNMFKNYTEAESNISIVSLLNVANCSIKNNTFDNFILGGIRLDRKDNNSTNKYDISDNIFNSSLSITENIIKVYDGYTNIISNTFNIGSVTQEVIVLDSNCNVSYIKNNNYSEYLYTNNMTISFNGYNKNRKNIENVQLAWWGNDASLSNSSLLNNLEFSNYKQMVLTLGSGLGTFIIYLQGFTMPYQQYLDARVYKFSIGSSICNFTINSDGTFNFDGQGNYLRNVQLIN